MPEVGLQTAWLATLSVFTILMAVAVLALTRELGVLLIRLGPDKPMVNHEGVDIGTRFPTITLRNIKGTEVEIGARKFGKILLVFLSPDCLVCQQIIAAVGPFASAYNEVQVVVLTKSPAPAWENDLDKQRIQLVTDESMFRTFGAQGTPFAVMLDESNAVESRGTPNSIAQLEALVSVQQYLYRGHGQHSLPLSADVMGVADVH